MVRSKPQCDIEKKKGTQGTVAGQGVGSPRHVTTGGGGLARVPNLHVCKHLILGVAHAGEEGRINVLPWYRLVGVAKTFSESQRRENRAARKATWSPRGTEMTVLTYPCQTASRVPVAVRECIRVTGKAGENGQHSGEMGGSSPRTRPSSRVWRHTQGSSKRPALDLGWGSGQPGSRVAIDWVTGRSYSSARRRINVQSGLRKGTSCKHPRKRKVHRSEKLKSTFLISAVRAL